MGTAGAFFFGKRAYARGRALIAPLCQILLFEGATHTLHYGIWRRCRGDCIIAATAILHEADNVVTEDPHFKVIGEIRAKTTRELRLWRWPAGRFAYVVLDGSVGGGDQIVFLTLNGIL